MSPVAKIFLKRAGNLFIHKFWMSIYKSWTCIHKLRMHIYKLQTENFAAQNNKFPAAFGGNYLQNKGKKIRSYSTTDPSCM